MREGDARRREHAKQEKSSFDSAGDSLSDLDNHEGAEAYLEKNPDKHYNLFSKVNYQTGKLETQNCSETKTIQPLPGPRYLVGNVCSYRTNLGFKNRVFKTKIALLPWFVLRTNFGQRGRATGG
jgi:hypothetical protein